jgi:hypothetical protein
MFDVRILKQIALWLIVAIAFLLLVIVFISVYGAAVGY